MSLPFYRFRSVLLRLRYAADSAQTPLGVPVAGFNGAIEGFRVQEIVIAEIEGEYEGALCAGSMRTHGLHWFSKCAADTLMRYD